MPSTSPEQKRTMGAIAHGWKPPASSGIHIPVKVAKEFNKADQAKGKRAHFGLADAGRRAAGKPAAKPKGRR